MLEDSRERVSLTSVVDSGDGVSVEHTVEEGIGVFRELWEETDREMFWSVLQSVKRKRTAGKCSDVSGMAKTLVVYILHCTFTLMRTQGSSGRNSAFDS